MKKFVYSVVLILAIYGCQQEENDKPYAFFVAGHTYGKPLADNIGLHPPFIETFSWLNDNEDIEFGILTGDIVRNSNVESWDSVDSQLRLLNKKVYLCPGNHDTYNRELYQQRYGDTYYSFRHGKELFIVLDGNLDNWNISGDQFDFLSGCLAEMGDDTEYIFIFIHQLVWWDEKNVFSKVNLNWPPYTPDTTNYWNDIEPMLQKAAAPVTMFAGDLGANNTATPVMYHRDENISYIASGMGSIKSDNFIIVRIEEGKSPVYELISLGENKSSMGILENYILD